MATLEEKRKSLVALLGGDEVLADSVLKQVSQKETEADAQQLAFKEVDEQPKPLVEKAKSEDEDMEDEDEDFEDEEDLEEEEEPEEEDEDEEEESKEFSADFLGDVPAAVFYDRLADALSQVIYPIIEEVKELKEQVTTTLKERSQGEDRTATETAALKEKLETQEKELARLRKSVKSMQSDVPQGARQFLASQAEDTLITEDRAKELGAPQPDPLSEFANFALGTQQ